MEMSITLAKNLNDLGLTYDAKRKGERHRKGQGANLKSKHLAKPGYKVQCKLKYLASEILDFVF